MTIPELVFLRGSESLLHIRLDRAEVSVGSNPTNDVVVPDASVPDVAALLIDRGARRFRIRDLTGGQILLNGSRLEGEEQDLEDGDQMAVGPYTLRFQLRDSHDVRKRFGQTRILSDDGPATRDAVLSFGSATHDILESRPFNIGSHEDNDLVLSDPFVSSFHCRIANRSGRWILTDLESTNGTEVNGLRVREAELPSPATIRIGKAVLAFSAEAPRSPVAEEEREPEFFCGMIAKSRPMRRVVDLVKRIANAREPVLIIGESGSGKELVARALHEESTREPDRFLALNCGALAASIVEAELFGHVKGAFTGAVTDKAGAFESVDGGTLFLDEIGELSLELQPKLLRVLETKSVRRVGGTKEKPIDVRVVAATHRNLEELVRSGEFREDLFHRLLVLTIQVPRLADRPDDILPLARHFLAAQTTRVAKLDASAEAALLDYTWPGNVRELRNVLVRSIVMSDADVITAGDLQFSHGAFTTQSGDARRTVRRHDETARTKFLEAIEAAGGNRAEAARALGISKSTFHDRLRRYGVPLKFGSAE